MPTTEAIIIREALIGDAVPIASLIRELGYSATEQFVRDRLTQLSSSAEDMVFIADCAGEIGGFLSFHVLPLFRGQPGSHEILAQNVRIRLKPASPATFTHHRNQGSVGDILLLSKYPPKNRR
jgi:hypothetical protein